MHMGKASNYERMCIKFVSDHLDDQDSFLQNVL